MASPQTDASGVVRDWAERNSSENDLLLRGSFNTLLAESAEVPPEARLIMYDACDEGEVRMQMGMLRKRLDARRNTKPKKPDAQRLVCTPFDPNSFHFGKVRNARERILRLALRGGTGRYDLLTNKFPLFRKHMLLVADELVPQQMTGAHLSAITEFLQASSFCAYFNSWCASASVNHFHCHVIDERPPVTNYPLVMGPIVAGVRCLQPQGFPGFCYVFSKSMALPHVDAVIHAMQEDNQPHNLLFTPRHIYVFPKPHVRPARSFELYPETVGGPELIGSFTAYTEAAYHALTRDGLDELVRINTAPLPSRLLQPSADGAMSCDDALVHARATEQRASRSAIPRSLTETQWNLQLPLHEQMWPQDRPIARSLMRNESLV